jgi:hypothetical protein
MKLSSLHKRVSKFTPKSFMRLTPGVCGNTHAFPQTDGQTDRVSKAYSKRPLIFFNSAKNCKN